MGRSLRRKRRWFAIIGLAVLLLLAGAYSYLRVEWEGPDLGDKIASILNKRMRGRISIGSVEWDVPSLKKVVTGGWAPVTVRNVRVWDDCALSSDLSDVDERRLGDPSEDCTPDDRPDPDPKSKRKTRKLLLDAPLITAEIDVHAAMFGNHDLVFRHAIVHGGELLLEQTEEPYPLHAYDRTIVSFLTAFYPRMKAGFRAGIYASEPPPTFDLYDAHVKDLNVTIQFAPYSADGGKVGYGLAARIEGVEIDAGDIDKPLSQTSGPELAVGKEPKPPTTYLHMNAEDPLVPKFYVRLALAGKHTRMRILDEGKREAFVIPGTQQLGAEWGKGRSAKYELELSTIDINRIAQLPDQWGRKDYVANNLELDISAHTIPCKSNGVAGSPADGADVRVRGELRNWWDRPYDGEWNLDLDIKNAGPTVRTCIKDNIGGDDLHGQIRLRGPFIAPPRIELDLHNLDFDVPLSKKEEPIRLTLKEVDGYIDMVNEQGSINRTTALIRGGKEPGEVQLSARFGLKPLLATADLDIVKPIDIGRFLPPRAVSSVGRFLAGKLTVGGDVDEGFELKNFDLSLGRTQNERDKSLRVYSGRIFAMNEFEETRVENVRFEAGQSRASINGAIEYKDEEFAYRAMKIRGEFPDLSTWLVRFGIPPIVQSASNGEIMLDGPLTNPTITVRSTLKGILALGSVPPTTATAATTTASKTTTPPPTTKGSAIPCLEQVDLENAVIKDKLVDARLSTASLGGNVRGTIKLDLNGNLPVITHLDFQGSRVDLGKLCGIRGLVKGNLDSVRIVIDRRTTIDKTRSAVDWLGAMKIQLSAPKLVVLGEKYSNVALSLNQKLTGLPAWLARRLDADDEKQCNEATLRGGFCAVVQARRDLGGTLGAVVADVPSSKAGRVMISRRLGGTLALDDIPLAVLDPLIGTGNLGGLVSATLHFGGDANAPSVEIGSTINLTRAWFRDAYVGDAQLGIIPTTFGGGDAVRIYGNVMAGQLGIDAIVGTVAPFPVDLALSGRRVEVDHFMDLAKKLGVSEPVQAWASGTVTVRTELRPLSGKPVIPEAWVELTEVEAIINHRNVEGRQQPLRFAMVPRGPGQFALSARVTSDTIDLACRNYATQGGQTPCPAQLNTPAGVVTLAGGATAMQMKLHAQGELDLSRLAPLLENQVEDIDGLLSLEGQVTGTFDKPRYEVALDVKNLVSLRLPGGDAVLQILGPRVVDGENQPGAQIKITNGVVGLSSFVVNVKDERKDEQGELQVSGSVALDASFKPASWGVLVEGQIAGKMLSAIAPGAISQASGLAHIDAALGGKGALPLVNATLSFDPAEGTRAQPLELVPRGVRRALAISAGSVEITTKQVGAHRTYSLDFRDNPLTVSIDNEGKLNDIRGEIVLGDGKLDRASVSLDADNVPYRVPGQFEVLMSARDLRLELPSATAPWEARGSIAIVSGTFRRNFVLTEAIRPAPDRVSPAKPFWDEYPSIGNADLDVQIEVRKFAVENNLGPPGAPAIELAGPRLLLTGSPREPRLSGTIRVLRGEFRIPATRARFTRTGGTIDFAENEKASNPSLDITSDADYFDLSGQAHTITMNITGTLEAPQWDLHTSTGYNKSQTLALLFLGRSPEQLSRTLGDQSLGANPINVDPSTNPTTGFADQIVKDLAGDWVSGLIGSSLSRITGFDVLRFEIGFGTVGIHAEKKVIENMRLIGDAEQTTRGYTLNLRGEVKTPSVFPYVLPLWLNPWRSYTRDRTTLQGAVLKKEFNDPAEIDITDGQVKAVYRLFIP